jgi:hypothetical protein
MQGDVHQTAVIAITHGRYAGDRLGLKDSFVNETEAAGAFGDKHVAVWKKGDAPRVRKTVSDGHDPDFVCVRFERHRRGRLGRGLWIKSTGSGEQKHQ